MSYKELILKQALESNKERFRLLAAMNNPPQWIFMWCNNDSNFIGMSTFDLDDKTVDYNLNELPDIIDNAETWLNTLRNMTHEKDKCFISNLFIMAI